MFQHTQRRVEIGCEQQRDMEQAFERIFIKTHGQWTISAHAYYMPLYVYMFTLHLINLVTLLCHFLKPMCQILYTIVSLILYI